MEGGAFRYNIDQIETRIIPGPKHYVAQLNLLRAQARRKPQDIQSISQPFNPDEFNFTWIGKKEVIFNLKHVKNETDNPPTKAQIDVSSCDPLVLLKIKRRKRCM